MEFVTSDLINEHQRWIKIVAEENQTLNGCIINITDVLDAHFSIVDYFLDEGTDETSVGGIGPRDVGLLSSAVARQLTSFGGENKWKTDYEKCASLFYGIVKNHAFHDCNKRTALLTTLFYLSKINRTPTCKQKDLERLTVRIANNELNKFKRYKSYKNEKDADILFLANFIQRNSRLSDKRYYVVTYHKLNGILGRFNYKLDYPHKQFVDIIKFETKREYVFFGKRITTEKRVGRIGFPGWTREVSRKDIEIVRISTKLTPKNGFDSQVFFKDAEPLKSLINEYNGPLRRLANK